MRNNREFLVSVLMFVIGLVLVILYFKDSASLFLGIIGLFGIIVGSLMIWGWIMLNTDDFHLPKKVKSAMELAVDMEQDIYDKKQKKKEAKK